MARARINKKRYLAVAVITFLVFALGLLLGLVFDYERVKYLDQKSEVQDVSYRSLQLQYLYLSDLDGNSTQVCPVLEKALEESVKDLSTSLERLQNFQKQTKVNNEEYELVSRRYLIDNLRYWMFSKRVKDSCQDDVVNVLYFYSLEECDICPNQGTILSYFKAKLKDKLLIFPINTDIEESFIDILKLQYNITTVPSLVIDDETYHGVIPRNELAMIICEAQGNREKCLL